VTFAVAEVVVVRNPEMHVTLVGMICDALPSVESIGGFLGAPARAVWVAIAAAGLWAGTACGLAPVRTDTGKGPATGAALRRDETQAADAGLKQAKVFWAAVVAGDTAGMAEIYADEVVLMAGSELLKERWELPGGGDRSRDLKVRKADLIAGYQRMIDELGGRERWSQPFSPIDESKIFFMTVVVSDWVAALERVAGRPLSEEARKGLNDDKAAGRILADIRLGDLFMRIDLPIGDDKLVFQLRQSTRGDWQVVGEATDY
jgi:hypothetical protein